MESYFTILGTRFRGENHRGILNPDGPNRLRTTADEPLDPFTSIIDEKTDNVVPASISDHQTVSTHALGDQENDLLMRTRSRQQPISEDKVSETPGFPKHTIMQADGAFTNPANKEKKKDCISNPIEETLTNKGILQEEASVLVQPIDNHQDNIDAAPQTKGMIFPEVIVRERKSRPEKPMVQKEKTNRNLLHDSQGESIQVVQEKQRNEKQELKPLNPAGKLPVETTPPVLQPPQPISPKLRPQKDHDEKTELHIGSITVEVIQENNDKEIIEPKTIYIENKMEPKKTVIRKPSHHFGLGQM